jgi:catechol 2,3-dioxygenase-like lactoylglutathione lyase family enzyme
MITGLSYVSLPVGDLAVAKRFYGETLGLKPRLEMKTWLEFDAGFTLALYPAEAGERRGGEVAFTVKGLAAYVEKLKSRGIAFPHGIETFKLATGSGKLARFEDPFGNKLELVEAD